MRQYLSNSKSRSANLNGDDDHPETPRATVDKPESETSAILPLNLNIRNEVIEPVVDRNQIVGTSQRGCMDQDSVKERAHVPLSVVIVPNNTTSVSKQPVHPFFGGSTPIRKPTNVGLVRPKGASNSSTICGKSSCGNVNTGSGSDDIVVHMTETPQGKNSQSIGNEKTKRSRSVATSGVDNRETSLFFKNRAEKEALKLKEQHVKEQKKKMEEDSMRLKKEAEILEKDEKRNEEIRLKFKEQLNRRVKDDNWLFKNGEEEKAPLVIDISAIGSSKGKLGNKHVDLSVELPTDRIVAFPVSVNTGFFAKRNPSTASSSGQNTPSNGGNTPMTAGAQLSNGAIFTNCMLRPIPQVFELNKASLDEDACYFRATDTKQHSVPYVKVAIDQPLKNSCTYDSDLFGRVVPSKTNSVVDVNAPRIQNQILYEWATAPEAVHLPPSHAHILSDSVLNELDRCASSVATSLFWRGLITEYINKKRMRINSNVELPVYQLNRVMDQYLFPNDVSKYVGMNLSKDQLEMRVACDITNSSGGVDHMLLSNVVYIYNWLRIRAERIRSSTANVQAAPEPPKTKQSKKKRRYEDFDDDEEEFDDFYGYKKQEDASARAQEINLGDIYNNLMILQGPTSCGKTSLLHACAAQLNYNVIEINVSQCRSSSEVRRICEEAMQSHGLKFDGSGNSIPSTATAQQKPVKGNSKSGRGRKKVVDDDVEVVEKPKHTSLCAQSSRKDLNMILFDDVDILFAGHDSGFYTAIIELISDTKCPVILTTTVSWGYISPQTGLVVQASTAMGQSTALSGSGGGSSKKDPSSSSGLFAKLIKNFTKDGKVPSIINLTIPHVESTKEHISHIMSVLSSYIYPVPANGNTKTKARKSDEAAVHEHLLSVMKLFVTYSPADIRGNLRSMILYLSSHSHCGRVGTGDYFDASPSRYFESLVNRDEGNKHQGATSTLSPANNSVISLITPEQKKSSVVHEPSIEIEFSNYLRYQLHIDYTYMDRLQDLFYYVGQNRSGQYKLSAASYSVSPVLHDHEEMVVNQTAYIVLNPPVVSHVEPKICKSIGNHIVSLYGMGFVQPQYVNGEIVVSEVNVVMKLGSGCNSKRSCTIVPVVDESIHVCSDNKIEVLLPSFSLFQSFVGYIEFIVTVSSHNGKQIVTSDSKFNCSNFQSPHAYKATAKVKKNLSMEESPLELYADEEANANQCNSWCLVVDYDYAVENKLLIGDIGRQLGCCISSIGSISRDVVYNAYRDAIDTQLQEAAVLQRVQCAHRKKNKRRKSHLVRKSSLEALDSVATSLSIECMEDDGGSDADLAEELIDCDTAPGKRRRLVLDDDFVSEDEEVEADVEDTPDSKEEDVDAESMGIEEDLYSYKFSPVAPSLGEYVVSPCCESVSSSKVATEECNALDDLSILFDRYSDSDVIITSMHGLFHNTVYNITTAYDDPFVAEVEKEKNPFHMSKSTDNTHVNAGLSAKTCGADYFNVRGGVHNSKGYAVYNRSMLDACCSEVEDDCACPTGSIVANLHLEIMSVLSLYIREASTMLFFTCGGYVGSSHKEFSNSIVSKWWGVVPENRKPHTVNIASTTPSSVTSLVTPVDRPHGGPTVGVSEVKQKLMYNQTVTDDGDDDLFESVSKSRSHSHVDGYNALVQQYHPAVVDADCIRIPASVEYFDFLKNRDEFKQYINKHIISNPAVESKFIKPFCSSPNESQALYLDKLPYLRYILNLEETRYHEISEYISKSEHMCDSAFDYLDVGWGNGVRRNRSRRGEKQERCRFAYTLENVLMTSDVQTLETLLYKHSMRILTFSNE